MNAGSAPNRGLGDSDDRRVAGGKPGRGTTAAPSAARFGEGPRPRKRIAFFEGEPGHLARMRGWCEQALHLPRAKCDLPLLLFSELVTNALVHTASGEPGGRIRVQVETLPADIVLLGVGDNGPRSGGRITWPQVRPLEPSALTTGGRGLALVAHLSERWWWTGEPGRPLTVWALIDADRPVDAPLPLGSR